MPTPHRSAQAARGAARPARVQPEAIERAIAAPRGAEQAGGALAGAGALRALKNHYREAKRKDRIDGPALTRAMPLTKKCPVA